MKRWLGLFAVLSVMVVAAIFVSLYLRTLTPEGQYRRFSERCAQIHVGMTEKEVDAVFGGRVSDRPSFGSIIGSGPYFITVPFSPTGPGDTRYLEVTFREGLVTRMEMQTRDEWGNIR